MTASSRAPVTLSTVILELSKYGRRPEVAPLTKVERVDEPADATTERGRSGEFQWPRAPANTQSEEDPSTAARTPVIVQASPSRTWIPTTVRNTGLVEGISMPATMVMSPSVMVSSPRCGRQEEAG